MADGAKKGITVKVDADLHAEVKRYLEGHGMTMAEFITQALDHELHPKHQTEEQTSMGNMRTVAFQVPEELFRRIKDYLQRNNMTQKEFILGLIERELTREQAERDRLVAVCEGVPAEDGETPHEEKSAAVDEPTAVCADTGDSPGEDGEEHSGDSPGEDGEEYGGDSPGEDGEEYCVDSPGEDGEEYGVDSPGEDGEEYGGDSPGEDDEEYGGDSPGEDDEEYDEDEWEDEAAGFSMQM